MKLKLTLLLIFFNLSLTAEAIKRDHVEVELMTASTTSSEQIEIGVHFKIDPEWHIYWKNPGDSGAAPKFKLEGGELREVLWPYPVRLPLGNLTNYGYDDEVVFPLQIQVEQEKMKLKLEWLVCKSECIPGFAEFEFAAKNLRVDPVLFKKYKERIPSTTRAWAAQFGKKTEKEIEFSLTSGWAEPGQIKSFFVYPENGELFLTKLPVIEPSGSKFKIAVPISANGLFNEQTEKFTFVVEKQDGTVQSWTQDIPVQQTPPSIWMGLLLAFLGGMILNLMPCVFPILFLKAFGFLKESDTAQIKKSSWAYSLGVVFTFVLFGGLLTALRFSGEAIGWGYQLQNPFVVYLLSYLFFLMALNFYGYFEWGDGIAGSSGRLGSRRLFSGSFGTGVLAVLVASPCTAPFMGSALGLTLLLPAAQSILVFAALGIGMALPMLVLGYVPALVQRLPRSGQWMIRVKQFLSFPLFATCLWLLWILNHQKGADAIFVSLISFLLIAMGIWLMQSTSNLLFRIAAWILLLTAPASALWQLKHTVVTAVASVSAWAPFNEKVIEEKRKSQKVFIDFTASWCITCQVNKKAVLETDEVQKMFKEQNVFLVRADWTNYDPVITQALARFGRNSVPYYVYYHQKAVAQTLPEILTKAMVKNLIMQQPPPQETQ